MGSSMTMSSGLGGATGGRSSAASLHLTQRIKKGGIPTEHYRKEDEDDDGRSAPSAAGRSSR